MLRVGIVGAGGIARAHLAALRSTAGVEVAAIHDLDRSAAMALAASGTADVAGSVEELIAACDAVFVCTWTAAHREIVEAAAAAGRAIFCEKPLAPTLTGAQAMAAAVSSAGVVNQVGLPLRWQAGFAVLRELIGDPANGDVLSVTLHTQMAVRRSVVTGWRRDVARAGGGVLIEVGFHDLDLLEWLFGRASTLSGSTRPGRYHGIEDAASVNLTFAGGAVGSLVAAWHEAPAEHPSRRLHVVCEHAQYLVDGSLLTVSGPGERNQVLDAAALAEMAEQRGIPTDPHAAFVRAATSGRPARPAFPDAVRVHEVIDAAYRSASEHATLAV